MKNKDKNSKRGTYKQIKEQTVRRRGGRVFKVGLQQGGGGGSQWGAAEAAALTVEVHVPGVVSVTRLPYGLTD